METKNKLLSDLLKDIDVGKIQLPDFQRDWVWNNGRIKALIASIVRGYPIGAVMFLQYGNESCRFKYRTLEGTPTESDKQIPSDLVLDGQQRLTTLYSALYSQKSVQTKDEKDNKISQFYYLDIERALDPNSEDEEIVLSIGESRQKTSDFGRQIELDLSTPEKEYEQNMFPLNIIFDSIKKNRWYLGWIKHYGVDQSEIIDRFFKAMEVMMSYTIPIIALEKETPKEAVCRVFENVNTGGLPLSVFDLCVATYSADDFDLRKDWQERREKYFNDEILSVVEPTVFLTAVTLLASVSEGGTVTCKKRDVLNLSLANYSKYADNLSKAFIKIKNFLIEERIFSSKELPYPTQLVPLSVICARLLQTKTWDYDVNQRKIRKWFWCGVFGELYGSANETRFANDVVQVVEWTVDDAKVPKTCRDSFFNPVRLLDLQTRNSAAYKGVIALVLKNLCRDFISGGEIGFVTYEKEKIDAHHIFPKAYCENRGYVKKIWNSVINKTPISSSTNKALSGDPPSQYLMRIENKKQANHNDLDAYLESHWIEPELVRNDNFEGFIHDRAIKLLDAIEDATGKAVSGRDSEEVVKAFGAPLTSGRSRS